MSGFIALHRDAFSHHLLKDGDRFRAWFWLVANAAWKPTRHDARGRTIDVARGQICAGREQLAKAWGWSPSAAERFLTRLETEHMIERETGQGKSLITICNYDKYQDASDEPGHMSGQQSGQTSDRHRTTKEQGNKETSIPSDTSYPQEASEREHDAAAVVTPIAKPKRPPAKAKADAPTPFRMTADWLPACLPDSVRDLTDQWPDGRLAREVEQFRDYWLDRTDKRPGWDRTFHNRLRDIHDRVMRENRRDHRIASNDEEPRNPYVRAVAANQAARAADERRQSGGWS